MGNDPCVVCWHKLKVKSTTKQVPVKMNSLAGQRWGYSTRCFEHTAFYECEEGMSNFNNF